MKRRFPYVVVLAVVLVGSAWGLAPGSSDGQPASAVVRKMERQRLETHTGQ